MSLKTRCKPSLQTATQWLRVFASESKTCVTRRTESWGLKWKSNHQRASLKWLLICYASSSSTIAISFTWTCQAVGSHLRCLYNLAQLWGEQRVSIVYTSLVILATTRKSEKQYVSEHMSSRGTQRSDLISRRLLGWKRKVTSSLRTQLWLTIRLGTETSRKKWKNNTRWWLIWRTNSSQIWEEFLKWTPLRWWSSTVTWVTSLTSQALDSGAWYRATVTKSKDAGCIILISIRSSSGRDSLVKWLTGNSSKRALMKLTLRIRSTRSRNGTKRVAMSLTCLPKGSTVHKFTTRHNSMQDSPLRMETGTTGDPSACSHLRNSVTWWTQKG